MIRILPPHIANKIAAGEVIERPASVVKELVENALDAEATRVLVELEEGGKKLIRVTDDGVGMGVEDLALAFHPHATSKIENPDDLFQILSYGFRGEALSSIGSVARATILSRRRGETLGHRIDCERSEVGAPHEAGAPEGTMVEVRDLFYNTPARRKFLKADGSEVARVTEIVTRLALARPEIRFEVVHNGRKVLRCEGAEDIESRLVRFFGKELDGKLVPVAEERDGLSLRGFIGLPSVAKPSASRQFVFMNDRYIKDRSISHAAAQGFEGFLSSRRYPVFFLYIDLDPKTVDVNVHPTKVEVRFRDRNLVFSAVKRAVARALAIARPMADLGGSIPAGPAARPRVEHEKEAAADAEPAGERRWAQPSASAIPAARRERVAEMEAGLFGLVPSETVRSQPAPSGERCRHEGPRPAPAAGPGAFRFLQIHASYILVEDDEGFYIVDQHALHERMLFEKIWRRVEEGAPDSQRLLVPEVVELSPAERERFLAMKDDLDAIGFVIEPFGGDSVVVQSLPQDLAKRGARKLLETMLGAEEEGFDLPLRELRRDVVATMACRAAVKFNDRLSDAQIRELLLWERGAESSAACPHGRPTRLRITLAELERRFQRKE